MSQRLVADELRRGRLKTLRIEDWPLPRTIAVVALKGTFMSRAAQRFLDVLRKQMPDDVTQPAEPFASKNR